MKSVKWLQICFLAGMAVSTTCAAAMPAGKWVATWAQSMTSNYHQLRSAEGAVMTDESGRPQVQAPRLHDATLRQLVLTSIGGDRVRVRLSNYYGLQPLTITEATVALGAKRPNDASAIVPGTTRHLTFLDGKSSVTLAPGELLQSDPLPMHVGRLATLAVSLYMPDTVELGDVHPRRSQQRSFAVAGNQVLTASFVGKPAATVAGAVARDQIDQHLYFLDGVDVQASKITRGIVTFGDSITDGSYSTGPSKPWPKVLAAIANGPSAGLPAAVVNAGISADELTTDQIGSPGAGASGLKRFERDVIDQPGVTDVVVLFGTNDLNRGIGPAGYPTGASAGDLIASYRMLIDVAHEHHLRIYAGTITPFAGFPAAGWYSPQKEATRVTVNHWIRTSGAFDGVIDFADAVSGPYRPAPMAARQTILSPGLATICAGDAGLHPNDRGYAVMGTLAYNVLFHATLQPAQRCH